MSEININGFSGANNVKTSEAFFSKKGIVEPRVILNADVDVTGALVQRGGQTLFWTLPGAHSLWAGTTCMLCSAAGALYRNVGGVAVNVGTVAGPAKYPLSYAEVDDVVYISSPYWQGVFDPSSNSISAWGVAVPPGPMLLAGDGNLPAGTYQVTMTNVTNGELSGSGPISSITLTAEGGVQILNRPSGALVWVTDTREGIFYRVGETSKVVNLPTVEPLLSFMCSPPPFLTNLCYAFGRMWGSVGNEVYYSEPYRLGLFRTDANKFSFDDDVTMIAKVPTGLFIGMAGCTRFLAGTVPETMVESDAGSGVVKGSLAYCNNMPYLADVLGTAAKVINDVPVWLSDDGFVAGNISGRIFNLTKDRIKMGVPDRGASLYRNLDGVIQILSSFKTGTAITGAKDADTVFAFLHGHIDTHNARDHDGKSMVVASDSATCEVRRGGVLI
jgi:hypothetical protein